jgi:hypothetical protein
VSLEPSGGEFILCYMKLQDQFAWVVYATSNDLPVRLSVGFVAPRFHNHAPHPRQ